MNRDIDGTDISSGEILNQSRYDRFSTILMGVLFMLFSMLLYLPGAIYLSNLNEFSLRLLDLVLIFLPAAFVSVSFAAMIVWLSPKSARRHLVSLCFSLGLLFWLQGNIVVWHYGPLDGSDIQWELFSRNGLIDSAVWLIVLITALRWPKKFVDICRPAAVVIIVVQSIMLLYSAGVAQSVPDDASARNYVVDGGPKYSFADDLNVILIVLDAFQSDVFFEIISDSPEYADLFSGFTYFRDAVAGSNYTELAIPALLTGRMFDNSQLRDDFLREAFLTRGITTILKRDGYIVDIYPWSGWGNESIYFDSEIASNLRKIDRDLVTEPTYTEKKAKEALHLLDLSLFRVAPHFLKRYIHNDQKWLVTYVATYLLPEGVKQVVATDNQFEIHTFVRNIPQNLATDRGQRVFKYYHLKGAHSPLTVSDDLEFTDEFFAFSRQSYVYQAKANLLSLDDFFEKLRQAGIYDNSLIMVLGDHGSGESADMYIEPPGASRIPYHLDGTKRNFRRDKARAIPLVLIKRIGFEGSLEISNAPVSLMDVPATILSELGLVNRHDRSSMFEIEASAPRTRYHSAFEFSPNKGGYVDDITVYRITGDSWVNDSWVVDEIRKVQTQRRAE